MISTGVLGRPIKARNATLDAERKEVCDAYPDMHTFSTVGTQLYAAPSHRGLYAAPSHLMHTYLALILGCAHLAAMPIRICTVGSCAAAGDQPLYG
jgi:hypothetical protein